MIVPSRPFPWARYAVSRSEGEEFFPVKDTIFFTSGREALLCALIRFGLRPGDKIVAPAYLCESALRAVTRYGIKPIFVDVGADLQMSSDVIRATMSSQKKIKAILLVHFFGFVSPTRNDVISLCDTAGIKIIEDCSHSFLSGLHIQRSKARKADAYIFSLRKTLPVADGGALLLSGYGDTTFSHVKPRSLIADLPFLAMRTAEAIVAKLGWPNVYSSKISRLKTVLSRYSPDKTIRTAIHLNSSADEISPSHNLMCYLCDGSYLRRIADIRMRNYKMLAKAILPFGVETVFRDISGGEIPQVLPVIDHTSTLANYLRQKGIGAYRWPGDEIPPEVNANPHLYPNAINLNKSIACLPVHQSINDRHIAYMSEMVSAWTRSKNHA